VAIFISAFSAGLCLSQYHQTGEGFWLAGVAVMVIIGLGAFALKIVALAS